MSIAIAQIRAHNFRQFSSLTLEPSPGANIILGENAAGKTTLLEAIYCLGRAKSFRSTHLQEVCGPKLRHWAVNGDISYQDTPSSQHAIGWQQGKFSIRIDEKPSSLAQLVKALPIQILDPAAHRLLQDGPAYRRAFLDWGVFHVEHPFYDTWRKFQRALRQRNHALRSQQGNRAIGAWTGDLVETASQIDTLRRKHLDLIKPIFARIAPLLLIDDSIELELRSGWDTTKSYADLLELQLDNDRRAGTTQQGPQRAELIVKILNRQAKTGISRGQQKLVIAGLLISQCLLIGERLGKPPVLLVDDLSSELSERYQAVLLKQLIAYPGQSFITSFADTPSLRYAKDCRTFHVEQGKLTAVGC